MIVEKLADGRERWRLIVDGKPRTVTTSASSISAMDRASRLFAVALKRLADR